MIAHHHISHIFLHQPNILYNVECSLDTAKFQSYGIRKYCARNEIKHLDFKNSSKKLLSLAFFIILTDRILILLSVKSPIYKHNFFVFFSYSSLWVSLSYLPSRRPKNMKPKFWWIFNDNYGYGLSYFLFYSFIFFIFIIVYV